MVQCFVLHRKKTLEKFVNGQVVQIDQVNQLEARIFSQYGHNQVLPLLATCTFCLPHHWPSASLISLRLYSYCHARRGRILASRS